MTRIKGVDISVYQKGISFSALKQAGVKFAIIRAGYGEKKDYTMDKFVEDCKANGIDFDSDIAKLNYRRRKKIEPFLYGNVQELEYDPQILDKLIADICLLFEADTNAGIIEDDQGFVSISDDEELPFE